MAKHTLAPSRALAPAAGGEVGDEKSIIRRPISTSITTIFSGRVSFDGARMFSSRSKRLEAASDQSSPSARTSRFDDDGNSSINLDAYSDALREKRQSMIKRQIKSLKKGLRTGSTISLWTINSGRLKDTDAARRASERNQALKVEIERLQAQLNSDWALGLTDEPPAGYTTNPAGIDRLLPSLAEEHNVV
ncbi:hypothetical protein H0H93_001941 [Arthromyces matolae]|nr:hypothetical protein H0H93_001941 [Arthromyces matolae]